MEEEQGRRSVASRQTIRIYIRTKDLGDRQPCAGLTKILHQFLAAIRKDSFQVRFHEQPVNHPSTGNGIVDMIANQRSTILLFKCVGVTPQPIGAPELSIDESYRRLPVADFRPPLNRDPVQPQPVIDQRPRKHLDGPRSLNLKMQPRWSDVLQSVSVREESKHFIDPARQPKFVAQCKCSRKEFMACNRQHLQPLNSAIVLSGYRSRGAI